MAKKVTELPAATQVDDDDLIMVVQDVSGTPISRKAPKALIGGGGVGGTLQFRLDPSSLDQLESGGFADLSTGGGGGAQRWSVVNVPERGDTLKYTPDGGNTNTEIFLFSQPLVFPGESRDMWMEFEFYNATFGTGAYFGIFFLGDDVVDHGFVQLVSEQGDWQLLLNNGTQEAASGTITLNASKYCRMRVRGKKPASGPPSFSTYIDGFEDGTTNSNIMRRTGSSAMARGDAAPYGDNSTLGATWDPLALDRFGIAIKASGGNPPPSNIQLLDFRVYVG